MGTIETDPSQFDDERTEAIPVETMQQLVWANKEQEQEQETTNAD